MSITRRILCVEDDADICNLVMTILGDYEIVVAQSKSEGLRQAQTGSFDLYLLSYFLPDGTGLELAKLIRKSTDTTPILLMVTTPRAVRDRHVSELGLQGVVSLEVPDLLRKVSRILHASIEEFPSWRTL
jgi:DNA-binding response OmpR family regulator